MALTITEWLRAVNPNIGLVVNPDGSYRIGVEDVNSDEALVALQAILVAIAAGGPVTIADGADVTQGAIADAVVAAGAVGTLSAKIRRLTTDLGAAAVDLAAIEIINTAINTALQAGGITQVQLAAMVTALGFIRQVPVITNTTGAGVAVATLSPGAAFKLIAVRFNVSTGAPLAAAETLTVTSDIDAGAAYDTVLFSSDLGTAGINDVVIEFGDAYSFAAADDIVIALSANAGGDTWGCQTIHELI